MSLSASQIRALNKIIASATELLTSAKTSDKAAGKAPATRKRRAGKELVAFRKMLATERANGASVAALAKAHGVSPAYIYQLPAAKKTSASTKKAATKNATIKKAIAGKKAAKKTTRKASKGSAKVPAASEAVPANTNT
jgi:hypothetical protein